jgi:tetratricopeptide repeat protein
VVLDDPRDPADLDGLWPSGPAGRVVITGPGEKVVAGQPGAQVVTVGEFSPREAMTYLMGCLSADADQRHGAIGLVTELDCQPLALAQASAMITTSIASCEDYQDRFTRRRARLAGPGGDLPPAGEVTWRLSAEQAERLSPGPAAQRLLALAALLGGGPIPAGQMSALGPGHPDTLARYADLVWAYRDAGRLADAATLLRDTLARGEQALSPGHPLTQALRDSMTGAPTG